MCSITRIGSFTEPQCPVSRLTGDFTPPEDACNMYRVLLDGLVELEADLHRHIHKENNILFPRASELEETLDLGTPIDSRTE